jgi:hypothetical protein
MISLAVLDGGGIYGHLLHYSLMFAMIGSAVLIFFYLRRKGRLDMDEDPKYRMLEGDEQGDSHDRQ